MPLIQHSGYRRPPFYMWNGHLETILPSMFFKVKENLYTRERLELADGDFLDIDWVKKGRKQCLIISHGLEGGASRYYVKRKARYFIERGWDIAAWNCRSCSGEMNRLPRFYHHGDTDDLSLVVDKVLREGYERVVLAGYSMGGSMTLKYLGERDPDSRIGGAVVFSVPCNLRDSAVQLAKKENKIYEQRFLKKLKGKIEVKAQKHPEISSEKLATLLDFDTFHEWYTAPLHGFSSKEDFFQKATCDQFLSQIEVPTLIVNAANDPLLGSLCYPEAQAKASEYVHLEIPKRGGHAGFTISGKSHSYMEERAESFIRDYMF